jgi:hypothetical protein
MDSGNSVPCLERPITGCYPEPAESILRSHTLSLQPVLSAFHTGDRLMFSDQNFVPISQCVLCPRPPSNLPLQLLLFDCITRSMAGGRRKVKNCVLGKCYIAWQSMHGLLASITQWYLRNTKLLGASRLLKVTGNQRTEMALYFHRYAYHTPTHQVVVCGRGCAINMQPNMFIMMPFVSTMLIFHCCCPIHSSALDSPVHICLCPFRLEGHPAGQN